MFCETSYASYDYGSSENSLRVGGRRRQRHRQLSSHATRLSTLRASLVEALPNQALRLQLLLRLSTAQEQVALLQWLVACATQWLVLEPTLVLLLSLTRCISTRLLALPEHG